MVGGMHGRGMHAGETATEAVSTHPTLCILVKHKIYLRNLVNTSTTFYAFYSSFITKHFFEL